MKIEDYIKNNRSQLDTDKPREEFIWEGIRAGVQAKRTLPFNNLWKVAAILIFLLSGTYILHQETNLFKKKTPLAVYGEEIGNKEQQYRDAVQVKLGEIKSEGVANNEVVNVLFEELQLLDTIYSMALDDLQTSGYEEKIVNTIFDTYERRISVLEKIIMETQKTKTNEKIITQEI